MGLSGMQQEMTILTIGSFSIVLLSDSWFFWAWACICDFKSAMVARSFDSRLLHLECKFSKLCMRFNVVIMKLFDGCTSSLMVFWNSSSQDDDDWWRRLIAYAYRHLRYVGQDNTQKLIKMKLVWNCKSFMDRNISKMFGAEQSTPNCHCHPSSW